ncbi:MAG: RNA-protein complex protein Nop10 [Thermoplasmata archaeon]
MKSLIRKCRYCKLYTMQDKCPACGRETIMAVPPRYSPADKFRKYEIEDMISGKYGEDYNRKI